MGWGRYLEMTGLYISAVSSFHPSLSYHYFGFFKLQSSQFPEPNKFKGQYLKGQAKIKQRVRQIGIQKADY